MKSIVFVHGFSGWNYEYKPLIKYLKQKGEYKFYEFEYKENRGQISLIQVAEKLKSFINENIPEKENIFIIGISQGGIISSCYLELLGGKKWVKNCICLCSPFYGTKVAGVYGAKLAEISNRPGINELRIESELLSKIRKKISKSKVNYWGVWNPIDLIIIPGRNAFFEAFKKNLKVTTAFHNFSFYSKKTKEFIRDIVGQ